MLVLFCLLLSMAWAQLPAPGTALNSSFALRNAVGKRVVSFPASSIWFNELSGDVPPIGVTNPAAQRLGLYFTPTQNGNVLGIRVFTAANNAITKVSLWSTTSPVFYTGASTNIKLAERNPAGASTGLAWQEFLFSSPVSVTAAVCLSFSPLFFSYFSPDLQKNEHLLTTSTTAFRLAILQQ